MTIAHYHNYFHGLSKVEPNSVCSLWGFTKRLGLSMLGIYSMSHAFHPKTNELSGRAQSAICRLLQNRSERGLNRVTWWGGLGLKVKFENQYAEYT